MAKLPAYSKRRTHVFFDISIKGASAGRMVFEMFEDITPITCRNFKELCTGERGIGKMGKPLHFKGSIFHRVIPDFMCQGGDFTKGNGTGGESIYGPEFKDENFILRHCETGVLSMANCGANTNASQFFLTLRATPHLDGKHVVFGRIVSGQQLLQRIGTTKTTQNDRPVHPVIISDCGTLKMEEEEEKQAELEKQEVEASKTTAEKAAEAAEKAQEQAKESVSSVQEGVRLALELAKKKREAPEPAADAPSKKLARGWAMGALDSDSDSGSGSDSDEEKKD